MTEHRRLRPIGQAALTHAITSTVRACKWMLVPVALLLVNTDAPPLVALARAVLACTWAAFSMHLALGVFAHVLWAVTRKTADVAEASSSLRDPVAAPFAFTILQHHVRFAWLHC